MLTKSFVLAGVTAMLPAQTGGPAQARPAASRSGPLGVAWQVLLTSTTCSQARLDTLGSIHRR